MAGDIEARFEYCIFPRVSRRGLARYRSQFSFRASRATIFVNCSSAASKSSAISAAMTCPHAYCQAGTLPPLDARRRRLRAPPGFLPVSRARDSRSAAMRFKSSDAGSSFGSCGTSRPVKA